MVAFVLIAGILSGVSGMGRITSMLSPDNESLPVPGETNRLWTMAPLWNLPPVPHFYRETFTTGIDRQWIDVSWNDLDNPHTVVIYTPETTLGPFRNSDNGRADKRIFLEISSDSTMTPGTWYYQVQAARTSPRGNDTFLIYRDGGAVQV